LLILALGNAVAATNGQRGWSGSIITAITIHSSTDKTRPKGVRMRQGKRTGIGWAWEFQFPDGSWHLCNWSEPFKELLIGAEDISKPSDEARLVRVELVPTSKRNQERYGLGGS